MLYTIPLYLELAALRLYVIHFKRN